MFQLEFPILLFLKTFSKRAVSHNNLKSKTAAIFTCTNESEPGDDVIKLLNLQSFFSSPSYSVWSHPAFRVQELLSNIFTWNTYFIEFLVPFFQEQGSQVAFIKCECTDAQIYRLEEILACMNSLDMGTDIVMLLWSTYIGKHVVERCVVSCLNLIIF